MSEFLSLIKQAALEAVEQAGRTTITVGTVASISPLKIRVSQKLTIDGDYIIKTSITSRLSAGNKVVMLREGSRFLIIDKVVE